MFDMLIAPRNKPNVFSAFSRWTDPSKATHKETQISAQLVGGEEQQVSSPKKTSVKVVQSVEV